MDSADASRPHVLFLAKQFPWPTNVGARQRAFHLVRGLARRHRVTVVALDEPPAPDSPLWTAPRLLVTPHVGGQSAHRIDAMTDFFCDNLRRHLGGRPLVNLVDKRLGFPRPAAGPDASP